MTVVALNIIVLYALTARWSESQAEIDPSLMSSPMVSTRPPRLPRSRLRTKGF